MANPEAVNRMAQAGPKPMGGMPPDMDGAAEPQAAPGGAPKEGLDGMVDALKGVGSFLQAQGPAAQEAMGHFQALLQSMSKLGGGAAPGSPQEQPPGAPAAPAEPKGNGRMRMDQLPGTQVL